MIGVFDSGHGGLTVLKALRDQFPSTPFIYLGDHANAPYGNRSSEEIVDLTRSGVEALFNQGCKLVVLGCNTATSIACRTLQQNWLPNSEWQGRNVLGIIAPTVEVATQTPWGVTEPQYPQMYKEDVIAVFATQRTIDSAVFDEEIRKRCPQIHVVNQACNTLAGAIEAGKPIELLDEIVGQYVALMLEQSAGAVPHYAVLGCTHYPLVEPLFVKHLPASCRVLSQPRIVAQALDHYLKRHSHFLKKDTLEPSQLSDHLTSHLSGHLSGQALTLFTTGDVSEVEESLVFAWPDRPKFLAL